MIVKRFLPIALLLNIGGAISLSAATPAIALASVIEASATQKTLPDETEPARQGLPGRRIGGGSRSGGIFVEDNAFLSALTSPEALTITTAAYPELLFHLPEMNADHTAEFVLLNDTGEVVYEKTFVAAQDAGLISVDTADAKSAPLARIDENYEWYFSIIPRANDRANDVVVHGSIRRVDAEQWLAQRREGEGSETDMQFANATPLVQAQMYKEADLWHDAALIIHGLHQQAPTDDAIASEWRQILEIAQLSNMTDLSETAELNNSIEMPLSFEIR